MIWSGLLSEDPFVTLDVELVGLACADPQNAGRCIAMLDRRESWSTIMASAP